MGKNKYKSRRKITRGTLVMLLLLAGSLATRAQTLPVRPIKPGQTQVPAIMIVRGNGGKTIGTIGFPKLDATSKEATSLTIEDKLNALRLANMTGSPHAPVRLSPARLYQDILYRDKLGRDELQLNALLIFQNASFVSAQNSSLGEADFVPSGSSYQGNASDTAVILYLVPKVAGKTYLIDFSAVGKDFLLTSGSMQQKISETNHVLMVYEATNTNEVQVSLISTSPLGAHGGQWAFFYCEITPLN